MRHTHAHTHTHTHTHTHSLTAFLSTRKKVSVKRGRNPWHSTFLQFIADTLKATQHVWYGAVKATHNETSDNRKGFIL